MSKHTPGPWLVETFTEPGATDVFILSKNRDTICEMFAVRDTTSGEGEANAERIVACVNACEGIADPSVVPDLVATLKEIRLWMDADVMGAWDAKFIAQIDSLIARAEGRS